MKQNYLYKCTDCETVKSASEDLGQSTWVLSCRACGQVVTEHYQLVLEWVGGFGGGGKCIIVCPKEKEENDSNT